MILVYLVKPGDDNEELRYSLRSLVNLPHDRVVMVGHRPSWVAGVEHIAGNFGPDKWSNVPGNLRIACAALPGEQITIMNDDFFVMRPHPLPSWHRGPLAGHVARCGAGVWRRSLEATLAYLRGLGHRDPLSYECHVPVEMHTDKLGELLASAPDQVQWRTLYGNTLNVPATRITDCKVRKPSSQWDPALPFLSTDDKTFAVHPVGAHIRAAFPVPSIYEEAS